MLVAVTGHRPNKLWGYDLSHPKYNKLFQCMYRWLVHKKATHCISGMGLGVDTVFALAGLQYRKDYPDLGVKLECAIPCRNQSNHWTEESKKL